MKCSYRSLLQAETRHIPPEANPEQLLEEIAKCADDYEVIPPSLSNWFVTLWQAGRIVVLPPQEAGPPVKETAARRIEAVARFDEYRAAGRPVGESMKKVIHELKLNASLSTFKAWRREFEHERVMDKIEAYEPVRQALSRAKREALALFDQLECEGVSDEDAVKIVHWRPSPEVDITLDDVRAWQHEHQESKRKK